MKPILAIELLILIFAHKATFGQDNLQIPEATLKNFSSNYISATEIKWKRDTGNFWRADFYMNGQTHSAFFSDNLWFKTETDTTKEKVPPIVQLTLQRQYEGYVVGQIKWVTTADKSEYFEVFLENKSEKKLIRLSNRGQTF